MVHGNRLDVATWSRIVARWETMPNNGRLSHRIVRTAAWRAFHSELAPAGEYPGGPKRGGNMERSFDAEASKENKEIEYWMESNGRKRRGRGWRRIRFILPQPMRRRFAGNSRREPGWPRRPTNDRVPRKSCEDGGPIYAEDKGRDNGQSEVEEDAFRCCANAL